MLIKNGNRMHKQGKPPSIRIERRFNGTVRKTVQRMNQNLLGLNPTKTPQVLGAGSPPISSSQGLQKMPHLEPNFLEEQAHRSQGGEAFEAGPAPSYQNLGFVYEIISWRGNKAGFRVWTEYYFAKTTHFNLTVRDDQGRRFTLGHLTSQH